VETQGAFYLQASSPLQNGYPMVANNSQNFSIIKFGIWDASEWCNI
jgi:hypothetical protein